MIEGIRRSIRILAAAAILCQGPACSQATSTELSPARSILFIGNSLTYTHDLPAMVEQLASAAGDSIRVGMVAGPNMAVIDHTVPGAEAVAEIGRDEWSYVVLQQGPTPAGICRDTLVIAAMRLAPKIRAAGGRTVLFLPWVRHAFPQFLPTAGESATAAARAVGGVVAPVGVAWQAALQADASLPLYGPDGYHPAPAGTLLAALTVYERLSGRDVRGISATALAAIAGAPLGPEALQGLAAAAHAASIGLPPDPSKPVPVDTTRVSASGGPC